MSPDQETRKSLKQAIDGLGPLDTSKMQWVPGANNIDEVILPKTDPVYMFIKKAMQSSIRQHRGGVGGNFKAYNIFEVKRIVSQSMIDRHNSYREVVRRECGFSNERLLFHGTSKVADIVRRGFDKSETNHKGMFGGGFYFTDVSSKANQYINGTAGCSKHGDTSCYKCERQLLLCRVILGKSKKHTAAMRYDTSPPGHHSVTGETSLGGLRYREYVVYKPKQVYPEFVITYKIQK